MKSVVKKIAKKIPPKNNDGGGENSIGVEIECQFPRDKTKDQLINDGHCKNELDKEIGEGTLWKKITRKVIEHNNETRYSAFKCLDCDEEFTGHDATQARNTHFINGKCQTKYQNEEDTKKGGGVYWERIERHVVGIDQNHYSAFKCLKCPGNVIHDGDNAIRNRDNHMYSRHRPFNTLFGGCKICGLRYVTEDDRRSHEHRKKNGVVCRPDQDEDDEDDEEYEELGQPLPDNFRNLPLEQRIQILFGPKQFKCDCGFGTNYKKSFDHHTKRKPFHDCTK